MFHEYALGIAPNIPITIFKTFVYSYKSQNQSQKEVDELHGSKNLQVKALPTKGMPTNFSGAGCC